MKLVLTTLLLASASAASAADLNCVLSSNGKELVKDRIELKENTEEEFVFETKNTISDFRMDVWTSNGNKISMLMLTDNDSKVSAYDLHVMGGEDRMEVNMLIQSIPYEATCYIR